MTQGNVVASGTPTSVCEYRKIPNHESSLIAPKTSYRSSPLIGHSTYLMRKKCEKMDYFKNVGVTFAFTCLLVVAARIYRCTACSLCWPGPQIRRPSGPRQSTARALPSTQGLKAASRPAEKTSEKIMKYLLMHRINCMVCNTRQCALPFLQATFKRTSGN